MVDEREGQPRTRDRHTADALQAAVLPAARRLGEFGRVPWVVVEATDRRDGNIRNDLWHGVQVGHSYWMQARRRARGAATTVREMSSAVGEFTPDEVQAGGSEVHSDEVAEFRDIVRELAMANWRDLAAAALDDGSLTANVTCLVCQHDQIWLCRTSSEAGMGNVWGLAAERGFVYAGICNRIDDRIGPPWHYNLGTPWPLRFTRFHPEALPFLSETARQFFTPSVKDHVAGQRLCAMVQQAATLARKVTDLPLVLCARDSRWHLRELSYENFAFRHAHIFWNGLSSGAVKPGWKFLVPSTGKDIPCPDEIAGLSPIIDALEGPERPRQSEWRELFGSAFGMALVRGQMLALFVGPSHTILVREQSAFEIGSDGLRFVGLCDLPDCSKPEVPISVHAIGSGT